MRPLNHELMSRIREMKMAASPAPTSIRPMIASSMAGAKATTSWPATMTPEPAQMSSFGPTRSIRSPIGIWRAA